MSIITRVTRFAVLCWRFMMLHVWAVRVSWRVATGRWHIFRDAPTWVVLAFFNCDTNSIGEQVQAEASLRFMQMRRDLEKAIKVYAEASDASAKP